MAEVFSTIVTSVLILVIGQIVVKSIIEPLQEFGKLKGEIAYSLTYDRTLGPPIVEVTRDELNRLAVSDDEDDRITLERTRELIKVNRARSDEAATRLRRQASQLRAMRYTLPWYRVWVLLGILPSPSNLLLASTGLLGMSTSTHRGLMDEHLQMIAKALDLDNLAAL